MSIILFLIILVALIVVHEFGHFIVAKLAGIRVDEFGIGFPPKLFGIKKGETEYSVNALPIGGFVKIFGEDPTHEAMHGPERERSFIAKPKYIQALVLVAGVVMNVLFAWVLFSVGFTIGMPTAVDANTRGEVRNIELIIGNVLENSPAENAGIKAGDIILSLTDGEESVSELTPQEVGSFIGSHGAGEITLTYRRGEETLSASIIPEDGIGDTTQPAIGVALGQIGIVQFPFFEALFEAAILTVRMVGAIAVAIVTFIVSAVTLGADLSQIAGPVGIVGLVGEASSLGFVYLLSFTAFISINLAIINLLPFPALDGGRLLFVGIETITRRAIKPAIAQTVNGIGFALLILLMVLVTYNDIIRLLS